MLRIAARRSVSFQSRDVALRHFLVHLLREEQRDIDVDPFADALLDGRNAFHGGRDLHHQVGAIHGFPQPARVFDGALRVFGQKRRNFQADVTVALFGAVVDRAQRVGGILNIFDGQDLVDAHGVQILALLQFEQRVGIVGAAGDGFFENGRVGGDAAQAVFVDQAFQLAARDQAAANVIQPGGLAVLAQFTNRILVFGGVAVGTLMFFSFLFLVSSFWFSTRLYYCFTNRPEPELPGEAAILALSYRRRP